MPLLSVREGGREFRDATTDIDQIVHWWTARPEANIGATPLVREGVRQAVVDIDVQNGGDRSWARLLDENGEPPMTLTARTGQGGQHLWFWVAERGRSKIAQGIDCKFGDTGYVVVPPSVHPITGRRYSWEHTVPVAVAPEWLRRLIRQQPRPPRYPVQFERYAASGLVRFVASSPEGQRNTRLFWAACRAAESGALTRLQPALESAAAATGLAEGEIDSVFRSAEGRTK